MPGQKCLRSLCFHVREYLWVNKKLPYANNMWTRTFPFCRDQCSAHIAPIVQCSGWSPNSTYLPFDFHSKTPPKDNTLSFGHCPNWGPPAQIGFDTFLKLKKSPKLRAGGGVIWAMPKRKGVFGHCFFLFLSDFDFYLIICTNLDAYLPRTATLAATCCHLSHQCNIIIIIVIIIITIVIIIIITSSHCPKRTGR